MRLFGVRRPRGFRHTYLYYDERRERLRTIEERAARELGLMAPEEFRPEHLRGVFSRSVSHLNRASTGRRSALRHMPAWALLLLVAALVAVARWLM